MEIEGSQALAIIVVSADDDKRLDAAMDFILSIDDKFGVFTTSLGGTDSDIVFMKKWLNMCLKEKDRLSSQPFLSLDDLANSLKVEGERNE